MSTRITNHNMNGSNTMPIHPIFHSHVTDNVLSPTTGNHTINRQPTTNIKQILQASESRTPKSDLAKRKSDAQAIYNKLSPASKETFKKINNFLNLESVQGIITFKPIFNEDKTEIVRALVTVANKSINDQQANNIINCLRQSNLGNIELEISIEKCNNLTNLNLSNFHNLRYITVMDCSTRSIDCSGSNHLNNLTLQNVHNLANLNVNGCQNLYELYIYGNINKLNPIDLNSCNECGTIYIEKGTSNSNFRILLSSNYSSLTNQHFLKRKDLDMFLVEESAVISKMENVRYDFDSNKLRADSVTILNDINQFCANNKDIIACQINSNESQTEISTVDITITNKYINDQQTQNFLKNLQKLKLLAVSLNINFSDCKKLTGLDVANLPHLRSIDFSGCTNLQNISLIELSSLTSINLAGCSRLNGMYMVNVPTLQALDLVTCDLLDSINVDDINNNNLKISINTDCKLANDVHNDERFIIKEKWALLLDKKEDIRTAEETLNTIRQKHIDDKSLDEYLNFLEMLKNHCINCATLTGKERTAANEIYLNAIYTLKAYSENCIDACRRGENSVRTALLIGKKLSEADGIKEKLNIIFQAYFDERIRRSLSTINSISRFTQQEDISELLELEMLINVVVGIVNNITFSNCAVRPINTALSILDNDQYRDKFATMSEKGVIFSSTYHDVIEKIEENVGRILRHDQKSLLTAPLNIVFASMLKDSNDKNNQRFDTYLFSSRDYTKHLFPPAPKPEDLLKMTIADLQEFIGSETEGIKTAKDFIKNHLGQKIDQSNTSSNTLKENSTLKDMSSFVENRYWDDGHGGIDEKTYGLIINLTDPSLVSEVPEPRKIAFKKEYGFDTDENYQQTLAKHLRTLLGIQQ